jgi:hypothetical protein
MFLATVIEVPLHMEPVTPDPFIAGAAQVAHPCLAARAPKGNRRPR